jgi:hypothetical protein
MQRLMKSILLLLALVFLTRAEAAPPPLVADTIKLGALSPATLFSTNSGNPNGSVTGNKGDMIWDPTTPAIWLCQGGTVWTTFGTGTVTGTGTPFTYARWLSGGTSIGNGTILDTGSFDNTTQFTNNYVQVNTSIFTYIGDFVAGESAPGIGSGFGDGRFISFYDVGSAAGGVNFNEELADIRSEQQGMGGNLQFWGNVSLIPSASIDFAAEWKANKTTAVALDDTFDLLGSTVDAGTVVPVCLLQHDGGFSLQSAGGYLQLIQASGSATTPRVTAYSGNPNTFVTGTQGDTLVDTITPALWQSTGGTAWVEVGANFGLATLPALTSCGSSPTIDGTNIEGTITEGSVATGCTLSFGAPTPWNVRTPHCTITSQAGLVFSYTESTSALTITNVGALSSTHLDYHCFSGGAT